MMPMKSSTKTSTCAIGPLCFVSRAQSSGCGRDGVRSVSSEKAGAACKVQSSGCGGNTDTEMISVVIGLKGGGSPMVCHWGDPQQS